MARNSTDESTYQVRASSIKAASIRIKRRSQVNCAARDWQLTSPLPARPTRWGQQSGLDQGLDRIARLLADSFKTVGGHSAPQHDHLAAVGEPGGSRRVPVELRQADRLHDINLALTLQSAGGAAWTAQSVGRGRGASWNEP
jgi:hypothetical protein